MARNLIFSNQKLHLSYDPYYSVRDLFWPIVGVCNHLNGSEIKIGVYTPQGLSWLNDFGWEIDLQYEHNLPIGNSTFKNDFLGIQFTIREVVHPTLPIHIRQIHLLECPFKEIQFFFSQQLQISEANLSQTTFYHLELDAMVHYKDQYTFAFGGWSDKKGIHQYSAGLLGYGWNGARMDAEDGWLTNYPIEQGSVDSIFSLVACSNDVLTTWMQCSSSVFELKKPTSPEDIFKEAQQVAEEKIKQLSWPKVYTEEAKKHYWILSTQIDSQGGILAANDSSIMVANSCHYSYVWPRDGALVGSILNQYEDFETTKKFIDFAQCVFEPTHPIFLQKYTSEGHLGASWHPWIWDNEFILPCQLDETALIIKCIWDTYQHTQETDKLENLYTTLILPAWEWILQKFDLSTGLPSPSWDLWEERRGIHTYTCCTLVAALKATSDIAKKLNLSCDRWDKEAENLIKAIETYLWDEENQTYRRSLNDSTPDASTLAPILFEIFPMNSTRLKSTLAYLEKHLQIHSSIGGFARYNNDYYARQFDNYPGNPWIICTLWFAQAHLKLQTSNCINYAKDLIEWCFQNAASSGVLAEQIHPEKGHCLTVSPLTWSHAELLATIKLLDQKLNK